MTTDDMMYLRHGPIEVRRDFTMPTASGISIRIGDALIYVQASPRGRKAGIVVQQGRMTIVTTDSLPWRGGK